TACKERMAGGTDFHADIAFVRRSRLERVPTSADDVYFVIRGMNTSLHWSGILSGNYSIAKRPQKYEPGTVRVAGSNANRAVRRPGGGGGGGGWWRGATRCAVGQTRARQKSAPPGALGQQGVFFSLYEIP